MRFRVLAGEALYLSSKLTVSFNYGTASVVAMVFLFRISRSFVWQAFYETFLNAHIVSFAIAFAGIWIQCDIARLSQLPYIQLVVALWLISKIYFLI